MQREPLAGGKRRGSGFELAWKQLAEEIGDGRFFCACMTDCIWYKLWTVLCRWSRRLTVRAGGCDGIRKECMPFGMKWSGNTQARPFVS